MGASGRVRLRGEIPAAGTTGRNRRQYAGAKFGVFKLAPDSKPLLVGLR